MVESRSVIRRKEIMQEDIDRRKSCKKDITEGENGYKGSDISDNSYAGCLAERLIRRTEKNE